MLFNRSNSLLVCVQSSWFVGDADVARIVLGEQGIPCHIENEHFHMWHWLCANITGGFKVLVARQQAEEAVRILENTREVPPARADLAWECPECGGSVDGDWDVCWYCTTTRDGTRVDRELEDPATTPSAQGVADEAESAQIQAAVVAVVLLLVFLATGGSVTAVLFGAVVAFVIASIGNKTRKPFAEVPATGSLEEEFRAVAQRPTAAEQSYQRRVRMGNHVVKRALSAAMFGVFWFPPLAIVAAVLLWRLDQRKTPCAPWRRRQVQLAWWLCAVGLILIPLCALAIVAGTFDATGLTGHWRSP